MTDKSLVEGVFQLASDLGLDPDSTNKRFSKSLNPMMKKTVPSGPFYSGSPSAMANMAGKSNFTSPGGSGGSPSVNNGSAVGGVASTAESRKRKFWKG